MKYHKSFDFLEGEILAINKEKEWTSFDVVKKIRSIIKKKYNLKKIKVGHSGTLDPLATGLLIICTGKATKKIQEIQCLDKEYKGRFFVGASSASYDKETEIVINKNKVEVTNKDILDVASKLRGEIEQIPPVFSAKKINGVRSYKLARKNIHVKMKKIKVNIYKFDITDIKLPYVSFEIKCSKGTYIRSLVNDFGQILGTGAYLDALTRTAIGEYKLNDAMTIKEFEELINTMS